MRGAESRQVRVPAGAVHMRRGSQQAIQRGGKSSIAQCRAAACRRGAVQYNRFATAPVRPSHPCVERCCLLLEYLCR